jgi:hypothetical protein
MNGGQMKRAFFIILYLTILVNLFSSELVTVAEQSDYKLTSAYKDVMEFLFSAQTQTDRIEILRLTTSSEGRMVPLVVISNEGIKSPKELILSGKPAVLIMANIHAGEIEGKEAVLMLTRDFVENKDSHYLENQVVLILPIFNPDGNDKFGKNRRDNGPELAGTRYNGQFLDLNRDYLKLESPEVRGLVKLFNQWDPVLVMDLHTTNGSFHREPVTYSTNVNPNGDKGLSDYMWKFFFPGTAKILKETYGYDSLPYGNFTDRTKPEKGWSNDAFLPRYGHCYAGLRNRFVVLDENYSYADFKTRVLACYGFIKSILQYTHQHIKEMEKIVKAADINTKNNYARENFVLEFEIEKLFDVTVKSYEFEIEKIKEEDRDKYPPWFGEYIVKKTDVLKDYTVPYFCKAVSKRSIPLPEAYILLPYQDKIIKNLQHHGIAVAKIRKPFQAEVEVFSIDQINPAQRLYQGHIFIGLKGHYVSETLTIPKDSYLVSMKQPLARLIPVLLEPESEDSLAAWGFFNRQLVSQWTDKPMLYPVYRLPKAITSIEKYQE